MTWTAKLKRIIRSTDPDAIFIKDFDDALLGIQNTIDNAAGLIATYDLQEALSIMSGKTGKSADECMDILIEFLKTIPENKRPCLITIIEDGDEIIELEDEEFEDTEDELIDCEEELDPDWKLELIDPSQEVDDSEEAKDEKIKELTSQLQICRAFIAEHIKQETDCGTDQEPGTQDTSP